jgi:hypothetical protein
MKTLLGAAVTAVVFTSPAQAQDNHLFGYSTLASYTRQLTLTTSSSTTVLSAIDSGWYDETGFHEAENTNSRDFMKALLTNFFVFDVSGISSTVTGATLSAHNPEYIPGALSTWSVWDVTNPFNLYQDEQESLC